MPPLDMPLERLDGCPHVVVVPEKELPDKCLLTKCEKARIIVFKPLGWGSFAPNAICLACGTAYLHSDRWRCVSEWCIAHTEEASKKATKDLEPRLRELLHGPNVRHSFDDWFAWVKRLTDAFKEQYPNKPPAAYQEPNFTFIEG